MKTYKCPYCDHRGDKEDLVSHMEDDHSEMIPEGFTPTRTVFNLVNKKDHGVCVVCKNETPWNENAHKYDRLCGKKKCSNALREAYKKNMLKVYNKTTLLNDADQQEKMLANRSISGKYNFTGGGSTVFTGSYEKKALEFIDNVLGFGANEVMAPGPVFEYEFEGKTLKWITDILLIPFNLVIEVKDGGANPNTRSMPVYREKQVAKEKMITSLGTYNYLRLTDNNFAQLLSTLAELKSQMIDDSADNKKVIININEEVNMLQEATSPNIYHNIDKFIDGKNNILIVIGFSGSGKSTLSGKLAKKYNCEKIELDMLSNYINDNEPNANAKIVKWHTRLSLSFSGMTLMQYKKFVIDNDSIIDKNGKGKGYKLICEKVMSYINNLPKNKKYIVEGVDPLSTSNLNSLKDKSLIIMGTTVIKSTFQAAMRDVASDNDGLFSKINTFIQNIRYTGSMNYDLNKNKLDKIKSSIQETYGAVAGAVASHSNGYITQYGYKNTFTDDVENFALHNDIISDNIITVDTDGTLKKESMNFLEERNICIYKFKGNHSKYESLIRKIHEGKVKDVNKKFFYEYLTGKKMLTDDQIAYDEQFEAISKDNIVSETTTKATTLLDEYYNLTGDTKLSSIPLMNEKHITEAKEKLKGTKDIMIFEDAYGFFARDMTYGYRTRPYSSIKDIVLEGVTKNVESRRKA